MRNGDMPLRDIKLNKNKWLLFFDEIVSGHEVQLDP